MTVQSITTAILAEARAEAKSKLDEASKEADKLVQEAKEKLAKELEQAKVRADQEAKKAYSTELAKAKFQLRNEELTAQRRVVEEAFTRALERLAGQKRDERKRILQALLKKAQAQMKVATVFTSEQDKSLVTGKHKTRTTDIKGGLIAESADGSIRMDLSYEAILADLKEEKVEAVTSTLRP